MDGNADISDLDLLAHARAGDTEAYVALFGRHHDTALQVATALGAGAHTDDLVAEAFVSILGRLDNGEGPRRTFPTYLELVLRQLYAAHPAAAASAADLPEVSVLEPDDPRAAVSPLASAFAALTPPTQVALWLREVEEVPSPEAGELTAMAPDAVDRLAHRAVEALAPVHAGAGPLSALLPSVLGPASPPVLTLVPTGPAAAGTSQAAPGVVIEPAGLSAGGNWRRARLVPALAAAGVVAATVALVGTVVWQQPDGSQPMTAAPAQTLELNPDAPQMGVLNGGRIAPALLGGQVGAAEPAVDDAPTDDPSDEASESPTDEPTSEAPEPSDAPSDHPTDGPSTNTTAPPSPTDSDDETSTGLKAAKVSSAGASRESDRSSRWTVTFQFSDLTPGSQATISVGGSGAEIRSIDGVGCGAGTTTRTCTFEKTGSATVTVTVSAPAGGSVTVKTSGDSAHEPLKAPAEETADPPPEAEPASETEE